MHVLTVGTHLVGVVHQATAADIAELECRHLRRKAVFQMVP